MKGREINTIVMLAIITVTVASLYIALQQLTTQIAVASMVIRYEILDVSLVKINDSKAYFSIMLKNSGNKEIIYTEAVFYDDNGIYHSIQKNSIIQSGQKLNMEGMFDARVTYGQEYVIKIIGKHSDGSVHTISKTIQAR
jgi:GH25 family lysozyme M1 (1,4-beta-N-acetylmuramidase)